MKNKIIIISLVLLFMVILFLLSLIKDKNDYILRQEKLIDELEETNKIYEDYINEYVPDEFIQEYNEKSISTV